MTGRRASRRRDWLRNVSRSTNHCLPHVYCLSHSKRDERDHATDTSHYFCKTPLRAIDVVQFAPLTLSAYANHVLRQQQYGGTIGEMIHGKYHSGTTYQDRRFNTRISTANLLQHEVHLVQGHPHSLLHVSATRQQACLFGTRIPSLRKTRIPARRLIRCITITSLCVPWRYMWWY